MRLLLLAAFLGGSAFAQLTPAAQWFLDGSSGLGNDSNACTTRALPCLTVAGLLGKSIQAGNLIAVRCGSTFREQYTAPANNVGMTTYDCQSLASPLFDASIAISAGSWTKTSGQTVTYQASVTIAGTGSTWVSAWENNVRLVRATSIANCDATAGSYFPSSDSTSPITLYVHASDGSNPGTNGKTYDYSRWGSGYDSYNVTGGTVYGITARRNLANDGSFRMGKGSIAWNVTANEGSKHNILLREGAAAYGVYAHLAYFGGQNFIMFVYNEDSPSGGAVTFMDCKAELATFDANGEGFYGHTNVGGTFGQIIIARSTAINLGTGFTAGFATAVLIQNATATNAILGADLYDGFTLDTMAATVANSATAALATAHGNVEIGHLTGTTTSNYAVLLSGSSSNVSLYIHDSTLPRPIQLGTTGTISFRSTHNTLNSATDTPYKFFVAGGPGTPTFNSDFNAFSGTTSSTTVLIDNGGSSQYTLTQWRTMFGQDLNSTP